MHATLVGSVNAADIIDSLFQEGVISDGDMRTMLTSGDPRAQCRSLLGLLHTSKHPQAFVKLHVAIKADPQLQWLVERIDELDVISMVREMYISEPKGSWNVSVSQKNIPDVFRHCQIFIIFGRNIAKKASNQTMLYFSTSPN